VQALHCLLIKLGAGLVVDLVVIPVEDLDRGEVFRLARVWVFAALPWWITSEPALRLADGKGGTSGLGNSLIATPQ